MGAAFPARAWGVEHLSPRERMKKVIEAGADQFGGEAAPDMLVELVRSGEITEARLDVSARRLLREKFVLGLFDTSYVDVEPAKRVVGSAGFVAAGEVASAWPSLCWSTVSRRTPRARCAPLCRSPVACGSAERAGDLVVLPAPHSRREKLLRLTPSGRALAERGDAVFAAVVAEVAGSAGAGGLAVTVKTLRAMTDVLASAPSTPPSTPPVSR